MVIDRTFCYFAAFFLLAAAAAVPLENQCEEKPCTREYIPVSAILPDGQCQTFGNLCLLTNAVNCRKAGRTQFVICKKGECGTAGEFFPCPIAN
ncbi:UNVERIFIED_CONTAM: hypothetical protein PYX00_002065 [Menopon gallinae]|uniref:Kazal-like domain-containing protein n=1 Tax=Menopon gallinae TaxID=328185 RepID=A0AAW2IG78_9NEOP